MVTPIVALSKVHSADSLEYRRSSRDVSEVDRFGNEAVPSAKSYGWEELLLKGRFIVMLNGHRLKVWSKGTKDYLGHFTNILCKPSHNEVGFTPWEAKAATLVTDFQAFTVLRISCHPPLI